MKKILVIFIMFMGVQMAYSQSVRLFTGVGADTAMWLTNSSFTNTDTPGIMVGSVTPSGDTFVFDNSLKFLLGINIINLLDISLGVGGNYFNTMQQAGSTYLAHHKVNLLADVNFKFTIPLADNVGIYVGVSLGAVYDLYELAGSAGLISWMGPSAQLYENLNTDFTTGYRYFVTGGAGVSVYSGEDNKNRLSLGLFAKYYISEYIGLGVNTTQRTHNISADDTNVNFAFGASNILAGLNFEYVYLY